MRDMINSLKRGLDALALVNRRTSLSARELCVDLKCSRTTARRVLDTLTEEGFLEKSELDRRYRHSPKVKTLSAGLTDERLIARAAEPLLVREFHGMGTGWRLSVATRQGTNMIVRAPTSRPICRSNECPDMGLTPMLHGTSGYVMLAYVIPVHRNQLLGILERAHNPKKWIAPDRGALISYLSRIRRTGFAHRRYLEYTQASVGVPIFRNGEVRACLLMSYPKRALVKDPTAEVALHYVPMLRDLATEIEARTYRTDGASRHQGLSVASPIPRTQVTCTQADAILDTYSLRHGGAK
jgi:IclR family mhp operon transcriptional activator